MKERILNNPALMAGLLEAVLVAAVAFGLPLSGAQTSALIGVAVAALGLNAGVRQVVTPVRKVEALAKDIGGNANKLADTITGKVAGKVLPLFLVAGLAATAAAGARPAGALELEPGRAVPADHDYGGWREGCGEQGGGCGNEREEEYGDGSCKYFCPAFDRSPVEDSFNPVICVMPGSCSGEERRPGPAPSPGAEPGTMGVLGEPGVISLGAAPGVANPGASPSPAGLFPPTFEGVRDFVLSTAQSGLELGRLFAETTITFVSNLLVAMV